VQRIKALGVPKDAKGKALAEAKRAQLDYERNLKAGRRT
jgi:hypothetical protein